MKLISICERRSMMRTFRSLGGLLAVAASLGLATVASANLLVNPGFETDNASAGDVGPGTASGWTGSFNSDFVTASFAHTGKQSLKQFGVDAGEFQRFAATPTSSWSATAFIMTPSTDELKGNEGSNIQIQFLDASLNVLATANPGIQFDSSAAPDTFTQISLLNAAAVPGTAFAQILLFTGPDSVQTGAAGGAVFWDDVTFDQAPEPVSLGLLAMGGLLAVRRRRA
jgi:MYXO-CTERM domain-containing protein